MRPSELIQKKRDGGELAADEISWLLSGYVAGQIPDYQMSAFLMAVYFRGMSLRETADFTMAMVKSAVSRSDMPRKYTAIRKALI